MDEELKQKLGVPADHKLVPTGTKNEQRKGHDTDFWSYDEFDVNDVLVARCTVSESMNIYNQKTQTNYSRVMVNE